MQVDRREVKKNLLGMNQVALESFFLTLGEKSFRSKQIYQWIHQKGISDFYAMTNISKELQQKLNEIAEIRAPKVMLEKDSKDGTRKWVLSVGEGDLVEMVLIPEGKRATLCISSQVGCAVDCSFCATGKQGFSRNLEISEIIGQLWVAENSFGVPRDHSNKNVTNVVMMGMGEPLLNFDAVTGAMDMMMDDEAYGLSKRKVTLSTSGLVPMIDKLSEVTNAALTISLHAPNDHLRNELIPINKKYPIKELLDSVIRYVDNCGDSRKTTIEYILIDKVNDSVENAHELCELLKILPCKINLIPFNPFPDSSYKRPSNMRVQTFKKILQKNGYITTIRTTRGEDIMAACGQLVGQVNDKTRRKERAQKKIEVKAIS